MAYTQIKVGDSPNLQYKQYTCDSVHDLGAIPNPVEGSIAFVAERGRAVKYIYIGDKWVKQVLTMGQGSEDSEDSGSDTPTSTELPTVTNADNGSVLTVVNGKWNKAEQESNYYTFGFDIVQDGTSITVTLREGTTFQAIIAATQKTHNVYMDAFYQDGTVVHNLVQSIDQNFIGVNFLVYDGISKVFSAVRFSLHSDNTSVITVVPLQAMSI